MFSETLRYLHGGKTVQELDEDLRGLVAEVRRTGRKGSLTLTLIVRPRTKEPDCREVTIADAIMLKAPALERGDAVFFTSRGGELARQPFEQGELFVSHKEEAAG